MRSRYQIATVPITALFVFLAYAFWLADVAWLPTISSSHSITTAFDPSAAALLNDNYVQASKSNVWADLSQDEVDGLRSFLYADPALNLTRVDKSTAWDNHLAVLEVLVPNKTDVLHYVDEAHASRPQRWARVTVNQGASEQSSIDEYMVGPLPVSEHTKILPLSFIYNSGRSKVITPLPNYSDIQAWFASFREELGGLISDLLGARDEVRYDVAFLPSRPMLLQNQNGVLSSWAAVHLPGKRLDSWSLLAQGLYVQFDISGRDSSHWKLNAWYYNGVLYNSTEELLDTWKAGKIDKLPANSDGKWTASEPEEDGLQGREIPSPIMVAPAGPRWKVDNEQSFVSWMGFEFYLSTMQSKALQLWDIRFGGERIMYELGLQEAMAHYAGNDPMTISMVWLDTLFGMGINMYEMVPGYDCPSYATFLSTDFHQGDETITRKNSICIFEYTADHPIQRHTTASHVTVSRNTYLVVRSVSTVGNYDYTIDYIFYLDGSVEVKVRASGYIFGAYHILENMRKNLVKRDDIAQYDYGYQVHDFVASSMHDHVINFKVDLDIAGTQNTMYRVDIAPYRYTYPWDDKERSTMRLIHSHYENETGLDWPKNSAAMYVVLNSKSTNAWGEKRGYKIVPGTGMGTPPHLTIKDSTALASSAAWSYRDLWLLRHHDQERSSASEYNGMEPFDPLLDFAKMLDGESVEQEDLVVYFNLGTHHVPHSGDVPNTLMHTSSSSVMFVPHNFHDRDPSRKSAQGVKLNVEKGKETEVVYFGGKYTDDVRVDKELLEPDLSSYRAPEHTMNYMLWNATLASL